MTWPFASNIQEFALFDDEPLESICLLKPVPTLLDLCIQVCRKLDSKSKSSIPHSLKVTISGAGSKSQFEKTQLSCLHSILEDVESKVFGLVIPQNVWIPNELFYNHRQNSSKPNWTSVNMTKLHILTRNVWTIHHHHNKVSVFSPWYNNTAFKPKACFLPYTHAVSLDKDYQYGARNDIISTLVLSSKLPHFMNISVL